MNVLNTCFPIFAAVFVHCCLGVPAWGQGSAADYQRAANFPAQFREQYVSGDVEPNWFAAGTAFWYRSSPAAGQHQFVVVDPEQGSRQPAFDHHQLAKQLAEHADKQVLAADLPFDTIWFDEERNVLFEAFGKVWQCNTETNKLTTNADLEIPWQRVARQLQKTRPSRDRGQTTHVVFRNRTDKEVQLVWIDRQGDERAYGTVEPKGRVRQHTYIGHIWVAKTDGRVVGIYEANQRGNIIISDRETKAVEEKTESSPEATERPADKSKSIDLFDQRSPDGKWVVSIRDHNVVVKNVATDKQSTLSTTGTEADPFTGRTMWSPDSTRLVVVQRRNGEGHDIHYVESSPRSQLQPKLHTMHYYKPGDRIPVSRPRLFDMEKLQQVTVSDELFDNAWSIDDLRWAADSSRFTFLYNQRGHQVLRIVAVQRDGQVQAIVDEQSPTFIDYAAKQFVQYLDDTNEIIWMSERDGWNHLYLFDAMSGKVKHQITQGEWVVRGVERIDTEKRQVWFRAGGIHAGQDPYYIHHARVDFDGSNLTLLTAGDGTHQVSYGPQGKYLIDTYSRVDLPPVTELRRVADGSLVCQLDAGQVPSNWPVPEPFNAKGRDGKTDIYGVIFRPSNFDPEKSYPILEHIYAGPHSAHVPKRFRLSVGAQKMAELGFIVVRIDGMGTSQRSKAFHDVCWQNLMDAGFPDRIAWIKAAAEKYPQMDLQRVGIYGGSAGGQNALAAMLNHGDFYHAAVADCGCHDNRMDKIWWNELWMGWPVGPHYAENSNVTHAHKLQGKLMLMLGEMDRNVDPASTMQVVDALVKADKDFDLVVMPGGGHMIEFTPYGFRRRQDFFVRHLLDVEPRHVQTEAE